MLWDPATLPAPRTPPLMDLTDFRLLVGIVDTGSVTRGAERAFLSLPAASNRVKQLETDMGVVLLTRSSRGVTPTPAGLAFSHHARTILNQLEALRRDVGEFAAGGKGRIRLHGTTASITTFLPDVLGAFLAHHPEVSVDLREQINVDVVRDLMAGDADVGMVCGPVYREDLEAIFLFEDPLVLAVPVGHPWARGAAVAFEQVLQAPVVGLHERSTIARFLVDAAERAARRWAPRVSVASYEIQCRMIESGLGVGIMPRSTLWRYNRAGRLVDVALVDAWAVRNRELLVRDADSVPGYVAQLIDAIRTRAAAWADPVGATQNT